MTTELRRTVVRKTAQAVGHRRKRIVIQLEPGDVISLREERSRKWFSAPISRVFQQVVAWNVAATKTNKRRVRS